MGIAQKISRSFTDAVRSRGQSYFAKGRVIVSAAVAGEVIAKVRGTAKYRVRLRIRGSKLHVSCTCPYFTPIGRSLQAHLGDGPGGRRAEPAPGTAGASPEAGQRPPAALGDQPGRAAGGRAPAVRGPDPQGCPRLRGRAVRGRTARRGAAADCPPWSGGGKERELGGVPRAKAVNRNSKRLLVYILDVPSTLNQNQVVIDLARRQRRPGGDWGPLKPWWHAPASPQAKYDPEDQDILALLEVGARRLRRRAMAALASAAGSTRWGRAGSCSASNRRPWSSGWRGPGGCGCGGPRARKTRRRCAGMTAPPGGSRSRSAPSSGASAGPGAARSAAATPAPTGWTWPSPW